MTTFVVNHAPTPPLVYFRMFKIGEVVVSPSTLKAGVKTGERSIDFGDGRVCRYVGADTEYYAPRSVTITVEL